MVHLQNRSHTPKDATALLYKARELVGRKVIVRESRGSKKYIEFDTSVPDGMDAAELVDKLPAISPPASYEHIVERHMDTANAIEHAMELFIDEKYWEAHEALEPQWKGAVGTATN